MVAAPSGRSRVDRMRGRSPGRAQAQPGRAAPCASGTEAASRCSAIIEGGAGKARPSAASCDSLEPILGDESEEFQGGSLRMLFTAFPLAHQTRCHVQISGENCLARTLPQTKAADFRRLQWLHWCKTQVIEFTHRAFVHYAGGVKTFGSLVNRRHQRTTVLLFHCISPLSTFQTQPTERSPCHHGQAIRMRAS